MIWSYRPYRNPVARKRYLRSIYVMYAIGFILIAYRYFQTGLTDRFIVPSLTVLATITFFSLLILRKPRFCYTDVNYIYTGGNKIKKSDVSFHPDLRNLTVEIKGKTSKTLYFERMEDLEKFLRDVGYTENQEIMERI